MNYQPNYFLGGGGEIQLLWTWANRFPSNFTKLFLEHLQYM
jgi:hypothetical protein